MSHKRLLSGNFESEDIVLDTQVEKEVLLVYDGVFQSMDGEVIVSLDDLERLVQSHNARMGKARHLGNGQVPDKYAPPVQLDHSESASVTVGRLKSTLEIKPYTTLDGEEKMGVFGKVTILGKDNVEKVIDGRWCHVSIGADFEQGMITELTITPFPAAAEASLLSKRKAKLASDKTGEKSMNLKDKCMKYMVEHDKMEKKDAMAKLEKMDEEAMKKMGALCDKMMEDKDEKKMASDDKEETQMAEGKDDPMAKMKEHMGKAMDYMKKMMDEGEEKKMSNAEDLPEAKLSNAEDLPEAKLSNAEDLPEAKLASEEKDDKKMMDKEEEKKKMSREEAEKKLQDEKKEEDKKMAKGEDKEEMSEDQKKYMKMLMEDKGMDREKAMKQAMQISKDDIRDAIASHEKQYHLEDEKKEKKEKKMSADHKANITKLSAGFKAKSEGMKLALKKSKIASRLSALKSKAKITPAEIKKVNIDELSGKSEETINELFKYYEMREPVVHTGFMGTQKAIDAVQLAAEVKKINLKELEEESLKNMSFTGKARLSSKSSQESAGNTPVSAMEPQKIDDTFKNLANLIDEGKLKEVKHLMSQTADDIKRLSLSEGEDVLQSGKAINELEKQLDDITKAYNELVTYVENNI